MSCLAPAQKAATSRWLDGFSLVEPRLAGLLAAAALVCGLYLRARHGRLEQEATA
jgi:hypothetical protein